ncbi:MAG: glycosyl hydrolase, partial [Pseudomonadota bacterium]
RYPDTVAARPVDPEDDEPAGFLVSPGQYTVSLSKRVRGQTTELVSAKPFMVERLRDGALPPQADAAEFWAEISAFDRSVTATDMTLKQVQKRIELMDVAVARAAGGDPAALDNRLQAIRAEAQALDAMLNGNQARNALFERTQPTVRSRLGAIMTGLFGATYGPTQTHRDQFGYAQAEFEGIRDRLKTLSEATIPAFETELQAAGAPWVPGGALP